MNAHDVNALLDCFDPDYESVQPLNPDRDFRGRETVRERWTAIFDTVADFSAELLRTAAAGDVMRCGANGVGAERVETGCRSTFSA